MVLLRRFAKGCLIAVLLVSLTGGGLVASAPLGFSVAADAADCAGVDEVKLADGTCAKAGTLSNTLARGSTALRVFLTIVNTLITIVVAAAFFYFFWNLAKYIKEAKPEGKEEAKGKMIWSLLAIFVIVSLWGIIAFARRVLGVGDEDQAPIIEIPAVNTVTITTVQQDIAFINAYTNASTRSTVCETNPGCHSRAYNLLPPAAKEEVGSIDAFNPTAAEIDLLAEKLSANP